MRKPVVISRSPRRWLLILPVALGVAGCGAAGVVKDTVTETQTTTQTVTRRLRARAPVHVRTVSTTTTVTTTTTATSADSSGSAGSSSVYRGNGTENVGTITVPAQSTLTWRCQGCGTFGVDSDLSGTNAIALDSTAGSGTDAVAPGTYTNVRVISDGNWAFVIQPG